MTTTGKGPDGSTASRPAPRVVAQADARPGRPRNVEVFPDGQPDGSGLTPRQRRVLDVIRDSVERRGYPPSMREIGEAVGLTSVSSVSHQLRQLQAKGLLRRDANRPPRGRDPVSARAQHARSARTTRPA